MKWVPRRKRSLPWTDEELIADATAILQSKEQKPAEPLTVNLGNLSDSEGINPTTVTFHTLSTLRLQPPPKVSKITLKAKFALIAHECFDCKAKFWLCRMWKKWEWTDRHVKWTDQHKVGAMVIETERPRNWISWHCMECGRSGGLQETS